MNAEYETIGYQLADAKSGTDELLRRLKMFHPELAPKEAAEPEPVPEPVVAIEPEPQPVKADVIINGQAISAEEWIQFYSDGIQSVDEKNALVTVKDVKYAVCKYFGITPSVIASKRKTNDLAYARQIGFYLAREQTNMSLSFIGRYFGRRDHTTVFYGAAKVEKLICSDPKIAHDVQQVRVML